MKFPLCRILPPKKEKIQKQHNVSPQKSFKLMLPYFHMYCSCAVLTMPEGTCCGRFCKKCIKRESACHKSSQSIQRRQIEEIFLSPFYRPRPQSLDDFSVKSKVMHATLGKGGHTEQVVQSQVDVYYCNVAHILYKPM